MNDICQPVCSGEKELVTHISNEQLINNTDSDSLNQVTASYCNFQQYGKNPTLYDCEDIYKNGTGELWESEKQQFIHITPRTCENNLSKPQSDVNSRTEEHATRKNMVESEMTESANVSLSNSDRSTPTYLRWAESLKNLLQDGEGVKLFQTYLKQEKCEGLLEFWLACEGLKNFSKNDRPKVIKLLYKKYIKQEAFKGIKFETKKKIEEKINNKTGLDPSIYYPAQREVEDIMMCTVYPNFLESDVYLQHIRSIQNNPALNDSLRNSRSSSSSSSRERLDVLPTVHEDSELQMEKTCRRMPLTSELLRQRNRFLECKSRLQMEPYPNHFRCATPRTSSSCHARYASFLPTSAQDSELQSLSSDAQTDDTSSLADSTVNSSSSYSTKSRCKKQQHSIRMNASVNKDHHLCQPFIPRTHRLPKDWLVKTDRNEFAAQLTEKLERLKKQRENEAKLEESLQKLEMEEKKNVKVHHVNTGTAATCNDTRFAGIPPQLLTAVIQEKQSFTDESDQSILDHHMSRVWKDSATPNRSPTPLSPTPDGCKPGISGSPLTLIPASRLSNSSCKSSVTGGLQNNYQPSRMSPYNMPPVSAASSRYRKERDTCSSDSGTVHDFTPENEPSSYNSQPVHIHKHIHHHMTNIFSPNLLSSEPGARNNDKRSKENSRRSNSKKISTDSSSSCFDSGVSVVCDPLPTGSAHERTCNWNGSLNEKCQYCPDSELESPPRHKKSSHYSSTPVTSMGTSKSSHNKKPLAYSSSRSGSLERGGTSPWPGQQNNQTSGGQVSSHHSHHPYSTVSAFSSLPHAHGIQPSQPLAQDPSMPMLPQPDTTTQLVEARRRLEDEARLKPVKGRISSSGREKCYADSIKYRSKNVDSLEEMGSHRRQNKKTLSNCGGSSVSPVPTSNDATVIGYCFSGEAVPYRTKLPGKNITLKQFKSLLSKKGNYRYFFKKASDEFGTGIINEEITDDNEVLPLWEEKIFAIIQPIE